MTDFPPLSSLSPYPLPPPSVCIPIHFLLYPLTSLLPYIISPQVQVVKLKGTDNVYAMKVLNKSEMLSRQHVSA